MQEKNFKKLSRRGFANSIWYKWQVTILQRVGNSFAKSNIHPNEPINQEGRAEAGHSIILTLSGPGQPLTAMPGVVGWEKNERGQMAPRLEVLYLLKNFCRSMGTTVLYYNGDTRFIFSWDNSSKCVCWDQCCGSGMIYSGSGSSFEFSEFRLPIQAKVPNPCGSGSNLS